MIQPVIRALREGHEVDFFSYTNDKPSDVQLAQYDVVNFLNIGTLRHYHEPFEFPFTVHLHHVTQGYEKAYFATLREYEPDVVFTLDNFGLRQLGRAGFYNCIRVRQAVDKKKWQYMDAPEDFAIGWLGGDTRFKRTDVIEQAAKLLDIPCYGHDSSTWLSETKIRNLYKNMSVYVVASFEDGGPLPAQEALLCGRPVVTTHVGNMPDVIKDGCTGLFYDGSLDGLVEAISAVKRQYDMFRLQVKNRRLQDTQGGHYIAGIYATVFRRLSCSLTS
jgi:glycosyltransferase involved in cell wall biosynthesis